MRNQTGMLRRIYTSHFGVQFRIKQSQLWKQLFFSKPLGLKQTV